MVLHGTTVARNLSRSPALRCPNDRAPWFDTLDGRGNWQVPGGPSAVETSGLPASYDGRELCSEVVVATKSFHNFRRWIARQCWTKLFAQVVATAVVLAILYFGTRNPCPWLVYCFVGDGSRDVGQRQRLLGDFGDTNIVWALMWHMYEMSNILWVSKWDIVTRLVSTAIKADFEP